MNYGNIDEAISAFKKQVEIKPTHENAYFLIGNIFGRQGKSDEAVAAFKKQVEVKPDHELAWFYIGSILKIQDKFEDSIIAYQNVGKGQNYLNAQTQIAAIIAEQGDLNKALEHLHSIAADGDKEELRLAKFEADLLAWQKHYDEAMAIYNRLIEENSDNADLLFSRATLTDTMGNFEQYEKDLLHVISIEPYHLEAMMRLGLFYHQNGKPQESENYLKEIGKRSLSDPDILRNIVQLYIDQKQYDTAIVILEGMLKGAPDNSDIHYAAGIAFDGMKNENMAIMHFKKVMPDSRFYQNAVVHISFLYQEQNKLEDAIRFLENVIREIPDNPEFMLYLGSFYEETGEFQKAEDILRQGIKIAPEDARLYFRLGVVYDKRGKKTESIESMKSAIHFDPQNANALNYLGYTYADMRQNLNEAERLVKEALKIRPDDGYIMDSLGWVYFKKGLYDKSLEILEKAVSLVPNDPSILEHIGDVHQKLNNDEKALEFYQRAIQSGANNKALTNKIEQLKKH